MYRLARRLDAALAGSAGELTLPTHLRMSGSWAVVRAGRRLPYRLWPSVRVVLEVDDGPTAYGLDLPVVDLVCTSLERQVVGHLGPDPLRPDWSAPAAVARLTQAAASSPALMAAVVNVTLNLLSGRLHYGFKVGDTSNPLTPRRVTRTKLVHGVTVNTGLRALSAFDYLYDADGGYLGLRPVGGH